MLQPELQYFFDKVASQFTKSRVFSDIIWRQFGCNDGLQNLPKDLVY